MSEFNPSDPKYKKVEDLPKEEQKNFKNVQGHGFVRSTAERIESLLTPYSRIYDGIVNGLLAKGVNKDYIDENWFSLQVRLDESLHDNGVDNRKLTGASDGTLDPIKDEVISHMLDGWYRQQTKKVLAKMHGRSLELIKMKYEELDNSEPFFQGVNSDIYYLIFDLLKNKACPEVIGENIPDVHDYSSHANEEFSRILVRLEKPEAQKAVEEAVVTYFDQMYQEKNRS